jgi:predicted permease
MRDAELDRWRRRIRDRARHERRELSSDVVDELASHLADCYAAAIERSSSVEEAERIAVHILDTASLGELTTRRRARWRSVGEEMPALVRDIRYALRQLRRSPGFAATALITLAIGIGANTAAFTLVHAVLLESLPVANAGKLYRLGGDQYRCCPEEIVQGSWSIFSYPFYLDIRDGMNAFEEVAATDTLRPTLNVRRSLGSSVADSFTGEFVSGNYFTTLGVRPRAGRVFEPSDDRKGAGAVAVASYAAWEKYGFDASFVGEPLTINGFSVTLVGVAPPGFFGDRLDSHPPDFWIPLALEPAFMRESSLLETPRAGWLYVIGRLRPGAQPTQVQAQLTAALRSYLRVPGHLNHEDELQKVDAQIVQLSPAGGGVNAMKREYEQGLYLLLGVSAAVLLIACANLANLLLVRGAAQRVGLAVERAMGASRAQIVRRCLTESLLVALFGGAAGLLTAIYATHAIILITFGGSPHVPIAAAPSLPVLAFTFAASLVTGVLFGAGPAWLASRADPADALRGSPRIVAGAGLPQRSLVVFQAALSLALITVAGLLTESLRNVDRQTLGFEPDGRLIVNIDPQSAGYTQPGLLQLYKKIDDRLSRLPGVINESLALSTPQQTDNVWGARVYFEGGKGPFPASWIRVGPRYFETIGTPLVRGRVIDEHDTADSRPVVVINETFAKRYFPDANPIGRHFGKYDAGHARDFEIVGVVKDARYREPSAAVPPMFFIALPQTIRYSGEILNKIEESSRYVGSIVLHVRGEPAGFAQAVRAALADVDPNLAPTSIVTLHDLLRTVSSSRALVARLSDAFGVIALVLAAVGLYGVTAYRVTQRKSEIGLRMALGATPRAIVALILRGAFGLTIAGLIAGIPLTLAATHALRSQLFGVSPFDVPVLAIGVLLVAVCAIAASAVPARRASAVAPVYALRSH